MHQGHLTAIMLEKGQLTYQPLLIDSGEARNSEGFTVFKYKYTNFVVSCLDDGSVNLFSIGADQKQVIDAVSGNVVSEKISDVKKLSSFLVPKKSSK